MLGVSWTELQSFSLHLKSVAHARILHGQTNFSSRSFSWSFSSINAPFQDISQGLFFFSFLYLFVRAAGGFLFQKEQNIKSSKPDLYGISKSSTGCWSLFELWNFIRWITDSFPNVVPLLPGSWDMVPSEKTLSNFSGRWLTLYVYSTCVVWISYNYFSVAWRR